MQWKDIPNYEGIYEASDAGLIRTCQNKTTYTERHGIRHWKQRVLKFKPDSGRLGTGYRVSLWKEGKCKDFLVARLIATTFLDDLINTDITVNHKDGNRLNNNIDNLEWLTLGDNIRHGFKNNLYGSQIKTVLRNVDNNEKLEFRSISLACQYIGRSHSYIHDCRKTNKLVKDINGNLYEIQ